MANTLGSLLAHLRGIAIITPWALALLIQDLLLSLLLLLRPFNPLLAYRLSSPIAWSCWAGIQFIFERLNGASIVVSGDKLPTGESAVVIANHVGWSDFYMIQHLAMRARMLGYCRYFAKAQLKKVPLLGWGLVAMGMPLVTRNCTFELPLCHHVWPAVIRFSLARRVPCRRVSPHEARHRQLFTSTITSHIF